MFVDNCIPDFTPRRVRSRFDSYRWRITVAAVYDRRRDLAFHKIDNHLRFVVPSVNHQPTRAFRDPLSDEHNEEAEGCADPESETPAEPDRKMLRIEQHNRGERTDGRAKPVGTVDH